MKVLTCMTGIFGVNTYFAINEKTNECAIIDPGSGFEKLKSIIEENGLIPKCVLLTHGHFDHIGALNEIRAEYDVVVYAHESCSKALSDPVYNASANSFLSRKAIVCKEADVIVSDGDILELCGMRAEIIHAPGHSKGSTVFLFGETAFTGDVLFKLSIGRTDFAGGDSSEMAHSIDKLKKKFSSDTLIYPGHGESSVFSYELERNPCIR